MNTVQPHPVLRVLSYNIHGCVGIDREVNSSRIAEIIKEIDADLVALQEVDAESAGNLRQTQADTIGKNLNLRSISFPVEQTGRHLYGLAVLSRFPSTDVRLLRLPNIFPSLGPRKRGAILATFDTPTGSVRLINTHLSVFKLERRKQMKVLLEDLYPDETSRATPLIFCGDLNARPSSHTYRTLANRLMDVRRVSNKPNMPQGTFHARSPIFRLDHIFVSEHLIPLHVEIRQTPHTAAASDHLPLIADLEFNTIPGN